MQEFETEEIEVMQLTAVTATIKDSDNVVWANCHVLCVLVNYNGFIPHQLSDGTPIQNVVSGTADSSGNIALSLIDNSTITPSGTKWRFTVQPLASVPASVFDAVVTGGSADLSALFTSSITAPRFALNGTNFGYNDIEVFPAPSAGTPAITYMNTTTAKLRLWNGVVFEDAGSIGAPVPANVALLDAANIFTLPNTFEGAINVDGGANLNGGVAASIYYLTTVTPSATWQADGVSTFIDCGGTGRLLLNYFNNPAGIGFGNNAGNPVVGFDPTGNADFNGRIAVSGAFIPAVETAQICFIAGTTVLLGMSNTAVAAGVRIQGINSDTGRNWVYIDCEEVSGAPVVTINSSATVDHAGNAHFNGNIDASNASFSGIYSPAGMYLNPTADNVYLNWFSGTGVQFGNGQQVPVGGVDTAGNATFNGLLTIGSHRLRVGDLPDALVSLPSIGTDGATLALSCSNTGWLTLNWNSGSGGVVHFGNGAGGSVGSVDTAGNAYFNGTISAGGAKTFKITHPLDDKKDLIHACLEGPENAVYYRGESMTDIDGRAVVVLPAYFEALCRQENRTIQLTAMDDSFNNFPVLVASRIKEGAFRVRSSTSKAVFFWEVKAVRSDIGALIVERLKDVDTTNS